MKKTLLLSVVASTMIMAGGDIAPVEPVVETPMVAAASGWDFGGQAVAFTQTADNFGTGSLFDKASTYGALGTQLRATNKDIFAGIGAGVEVSGIQSNERTVQTGGFYGTGGSAGETSGGVTQAYLTYGMGNTSLKIGRQTLPKGLSPFAFSEGWQMFKNTFDAALVVNSDLPDTTLVYAAVTKSNQSVGGYAGRYAFNQIAGLNADVVHMLTLQNKSIEGLTLTGSYYFAPDMVSNGNDASALWGDAKFKISDYSVALQGGVIDPDTLTKTTAFGAKVGGNFGMFGASIAYSSVDEGSVGVTNFGTGVKSPLYTQMVLNNVGQLHANNADYLKVSANVKALGGKFIVNYGTALELRDRGTAAAGHLGMVRAPKTSADTGRNPTELDLMFKTKLTDNITAFAAYVNVDQDVSGQDSANFVRFWARYNFN